MGDSIRRRFRSLIRRESDDSGGTSSAHSPASQRPSPLTPPPPAAAAATAATATHHAAARFPKRDSSLTALYDVDDAHADADDNDDDDDGGRRLRPQPVLTIEEASPPPPPASSSSKPSSVRNASTAQLGPTLARIRSFRPPLLRASSRTSYAAKSAPSTDSVVDVDDDHATPAAVEEETTPAAAAPGMSRRKVWVCRPGASPTLVQVAADDLVDDVRDMILRKYANSLGRSFDSPDVTLRILPRDKGPHAARERTLGPDELMAATLDAYFPGGQSIDEALIIDVPRSRTPRPSPRVLPPHAAVHYFHDQRPLEDDTGYFPPMPDSGQPPALPSPGDRKLHGRPRLRRQHTSSPVSNLSNAGTAPGSFAPGHPTRAPTRAHTHRGESGDLLNSGAHTPNPAALPTPPATTDPAGPPAGGASSLSGHAPVSSPTSLSPRVPPSSQKAKKTRKPAAAATANGALQARRRDAGPALGLEGLLFADAVPPINVLIVEDNIINLKLLEMFVKRLKVRWASVMNGRDAVGKWREGGFHLVLMDIQLPIMSGLEATKEIRRLERVNGIGVFARSEGESRAPSPVKRAAAADDALTGTFKSPVIIVALTASSLQSDRHEALAAGCNDFLTKPVNFPWFERKILEWGCMQALIDFDGWRQWKALNSAPAADGKPDKPATDKAKKKELSPEEKEAKAAKKAALMAKMGVA